VTASSVPMTGRMVSPPRVLVGSRARVEPVRRDHTSRHERLSRWAPGDGERQRPAAERAASTRQHEPQAAGIGLAADRGR
jgi:hypothetical protein